MPGASDTLDEIFILSIDEINQYLPNESDRAAEEWWWLRSRGSIYTAALVSDIGIVNDYGRRVDNSYGVRPALWISLET